MKLAALLVVFGACAPALAGSNLIIGFGGNHPAQEWTQDGQYVYDWGHLGHASGAAVMTGGDLWICNPADGSNVFEHVDEANAPLGGYTASVGGGWIGDMSGYTGDSLLAGTLDGTVWKIDPAAGLEIPLFATAGTHIGVAWDGQNIWTTDGPAGWGIQQRTASGQVLWSFDDPRGGPCGIAFDRADGTLYVGHADGRVSHLGADGAPLGGFVLWPDDIIDGLDIMPIPAPGVVGIAGMGMLGALRRRR